MCFESQVFVFSHLNSGATSVVYRCRQKGTQKPYAVKLLKKTVSMRERQREGDIPVLSVSHDSNVFMFE